MITHDTACNNKISKELHSIPYSGHLCVQRTLARVRRGFYWKGQTGDSRIFFESCLVCQIEKSDHSLTHSQLQSTKIPEEKWQQVSIDFITDLLEIPRWVNSIMAMINEDTRMTHVIPCTKTITTTQIAQLY